jgi:hypothetical protein
MTIEEREDRHSSGLYRKRPLTIVRADGATADALSS